MLINASCAFVDGAHNVERSVWNSPDTLNYVSDISPPIKSLQPAAQPSEKLR